MSEYISYGDGVLDVLGLTAEQVAAMSMSELIMLADDLDLDVLVTSELAINDEPGRLSLTMTVPAEAGKKPATSRPDDIPQDVWGAASDIMDDACLGGYWVKNGVDGTLRRAISEALMAERERCANVVGFAASALRRVTPVDESPAGKVAASMLESLGFLAAAIRGIGDDR